MAETNLQVPPNSTGQKLRMRSRVVGADTVLEQAIYNTSLPTYYVLADAVAFAGNKHHIAILNQAGSGKVIHVRKLFHINLSLSAVTGVALRFDVKKATAVTGGTAITPQAADSDNPALSGMTFATGATVTEGALLYPLTTQNDELTAANTAIANYLMQALNLQPEGVEIQELRLRPGEGLTVKQITTSTVGSFAWLAVITVDDDI